jgi:hypothetical protein
LLYPKAIKQTNLSFFMIKFKTASIKHTKMGGFFSRYRCKTVLCTVKGIGACFFQHPNSPESHILKKKIHQKVATRHVSMIPLHRDPRSTCRGGNRGNRTWRDARFSPFGGWQWRLSRIPLHRDPRSGCYVGKNQLVRGEFQGAA